MWGHWHRLGSVAMVGTTLGNLSAAVGRAWRSVRADHPDDAFDPYEKTPMERDALCAMFELESGRAMSASEKLRESERLERDTMSMIRGALYPAD